MKIIGYLNFAGRIAASASSLYARNLYAFTELFVDKESGKLTIDWDDELIAATVLTRDGKIVHPALAQKTCTNKKNTGQKHSRGKKGNARQENSPSEKARARKESGTPKNGDGS